MPDPEVVPELDPIPDRKAERVPDNIVRIRDWANSHSHDDGEV